MVVKTQKRGGRQITAPGHFIHHAFNAMTQGQVRKRRYIRETPENACYLNEYTGFYKKSSFAPSTGAVRSISLLAIRCFFATD
jgi:hypothetical protein